MLRVFELNVKNPCICQTEKIAQMRRVFFEELDCHHDLPIVLRPRQFRMRHLDFLARMSQNRGLSRTLEY